VTPDLQLRYAARVRGGLLVMAVLAGCYNPSAPLGAPCATDDGCPSGQVCVASRCALPTMDGPGSGSDAGTMMSDAAPEASTVELSDDFSNGLQGWEVVSPTGAWTAGAGVAEVHSGPDGEDFLARPLSSTGNFRMTVLLTVDALVGDRDHLIGGAVRAHPSVDAGVDCLVSQQAGQGQQLILLDAASGEDGGAQPFTLHFGMQYRMEVTIVGPATYTCQVGTTTAQADARVAVARPAYVVLYASGVDARIDSVQVDRLP
jgi:hypothetical protein